MHAAELRLVEMRIPLQRFFHRYHNLFDSAHFLGKKTPKEIMESREDYESQLVYATFFNVTYRQQKKELSYSHFHSTRGMTPIQIKARHLSPSMMAICSLGALSSSDMTKQ